MPRNHWPQVLWLLRHGESQYNVLRDKYPREVVAQMVATAEGRAELERLFAELPSDPVTPLTDRGRAQAVRTGQGLRALSFPLDRLYVSPYYRTRETAILILNELTRGTDTVVVSPWGEQEREMIRKYSGYELPFLENHLPFDGPEHCELLATRCRPFIEVVEDSRVREREFGVASLPTVRDVPTGTLDPEQRQVMERFDAHFSRPESGESLEDVKMRVRDFIGHLTRKPRGKAVGVVTHAHTIMCTRAVLEKKLFRIPEVLLHADDTDWVRSCSVTSYRLDQGETLVLDRYNQCLY